MSLPYHDSKTENPAGLPPGFSYNTVHHAQTPQTSPGPESLSQNTLPEKYSVAGIIRTLLNHALHALQVRKTVLTLNESVYNFILQR